MLDASYGYLKIDIDEHCSDKKCVYVTSRTVHNHTRAVFSR